MKEHLLPRIQKKLQIAAADLELHNPALTLEMAQSSVIIMKNQIYSHKLVRFYHTTYDVRRSEDVINSRTSHCDVMLLSNFTSSKPSSLQTPEDSGHPFLYGRVIGIFHANIVYIGPGRTEDNEPMHFDFLFIRWFQLDNAHIPIKNSASNSSWESLRLDRLSFPPATSKDAFGFIDPTLILRSCHLIPAFSLGKNETGRSSHTVSASRIWQNGNDWNGYYINRCEVL